MNFPNLKMALMVSELSPYAQSGGLAQMVASLGKALHQSGARPAFFLPNYSQIILKNYEILEPTWQVIVGNKYYKAGFWRTITNSGIPVYLLDIPDYFNRKGLYGESGTDYPDNAARFIAFSRGCLEGMKALNLEFDILHVHDWQAAMIPFYLRSHYAADPFFSRTSTLLTIHNLSYQGFFPADQFALTGLDKKFFHMNFLEFYGGINFLKGGILAADFLTTVSPTYAQEVLSSEFGCELEGVLAQRKERFFGILNGIDYHQWNPTEDPYLAYRYGDENLENKTKNKWTLQKELGLEVNNKAPLIAMVTRLVEQKGIDLVLSLLPEFTSQKIQLAILGSGAPSIENRLKELAGKYNRTLALRLGFDVALSHRITAGADFILVPSLFEPCGFNQMFGMRYGTVPIVRATGGLRDTVVDFTEAPDTGTGFCFEKPEPQALWDAIARAIEAYRKPALFKRLQIRGMARNYSWDQSAREYMDLYQKALLERHEF